MLVPTEHDRRKFDRLTVCVKIREDLEKLKKTVSVSDRRKIFTKKRGPPTKKAKKDPLKTT